MSLRDRLICFAGFVGMTLLVVLFLLPIPNCFLSVCLQTLFAAVLKFFLPITTSAISGSVNSNKSAPTCFAVWTIYLRKNGIAVLPKLVQEPQISFPSVFQPLYSMEFLLVLKQPSCSIVCFKNERWTPF